MAAVDGQRGGEGGGRTTYRRDDRGSRKASVGPPSCTASKLSGSKTGWESAITASVLCEIGAKAGREKGLTVHILIHRPSCRSRLTVLNDCDPPLIWHTASVRP